MTHSSKFTVFITAILLALSGILSTAMTSHKQTQSPLGASLYAVEGYGKLPYAFESNQGQFDPEVKFAARGAGYGLFLTSKEAVLALSQQKKQKGEANNPEAGSSAAVRMHLIGAMASKQIEGLDLLPGKSHYFIGKDSRNWHSNISQYARVSYKNVYPGIDLIYYGNQRELEYDFEVAPGANPKSIELAFEGIDGMAIDAQGNLDLNIAGGKLRQYKPLVYQGTGTNRKEITGRYIIADKNRVRFAIGQYDSNQALTIDPILSYATYFGGSGDDISFAIAVDAAGNAYITGRTSSSNLPITPGAYKSAIASYDVFIAKLNNTGGSLVYSTFLGGSNSDGGVGIAVDGGGNAYVTGPTDSPNFPTTPGAPQSSYGGGLSDAFVTKLNANGSTLLYSTYLGGNDYDTSSGLAVASMGNVTITGFTYSTNFPKANAYQNVIGGKMDAFISQLNAAGTALICSTYLGGNSNDGGYAVAVDSAGNSYITGGTESTFFPTTAGAPQIVYGGGIGDAFITKFNPTGSLIYSTFLGGDSPDAGLGIAVDSAGNVYVTGRTSSTNFPITSAAAQPAIAGSSDAFIAKLNPAGSALVYSTYLGGNSDDVGDGIAIDSSGNAWIAGSTGSDNFPTVNPIQPTLGGDWDVFIAILNPTGTGLQFSTYFGGSLDDLAKGIALDSSGNAYIPGHTCSSGFSTTIGAFQTKQSGGYDAFVIKLGDKLANMLGLNIQMNQNNYGNGDAVIATEFRLYNLGAAHVPAELKVWLAVPGVSPITVLNLGYDGLFFIPAGLNVDLGPISLVTVNASFIRGIYEFNSRLVNPFTGAFLSEDINPFAIQ